MTHDTHFRHDATSAFGSAATRWDTLSGDTHIGDSAAARGEHIAAPELNNQQTARGDGEQA